MVVDWSKDKRRGRKSIAVDGRTGSTSGGSGDLEVAPQVAPQEASMVTGWQRSPGRGRGQEERPWWPRGHVESRGDHEGGSSRDTSLEPERGGFSLDVIPWDTSPNMKNPSLETSPENPQAANTLYRFKGKTLAQYEDDLTLHKNTMDETKDTVDENKNNTVDETVDGTSGESPDESRREHEEGSSRHTSWETETGGSSLDIRPWDTSPNMKNTSLETSPENTNTAVTKDDLDGLTSHMNTMDMTNDNTVDENKNNMVHVHMGTSDSPAVWTVWASMMSKNDIGHTHNALDDIFKDTGHEGHESNESRDEGSTGLEVHQGNRKYVMDVYQLLGKALEGKSTYAETRRSIKDYVLSSEGYATC